jgi:hypothetical protein
MTSLDNAISDLELVEKRLKGALADLDAMGIHLFCDRTPLTVYINHLISLREYYEEKAQGVSR